MEKKMSKRLLIAKDAMCAILSATRVVGDQIYNFERIVSDAYKLADELLKQEDS